MHFVCFKPGESGLMARLSNKAGRWVWGAHVSRRAGEGVPALVDACAPRPKATFSLWPPGKMYDTL